MPLLELVACSLGPAPVEMLAELTARDEMSVRKSLAGLKKWQMVEFEGMKPSSTRLFASSSSTTWARTGKGTP